MGNLKFEDAKKYLKAIESSKKKYLTCEMLAKDIGIYPDIIATHLSVFDPLLTMDASIDLRSIQKPLTIFVNEKENRKINRKVKVANTNYKSVNDFIFNKYVVAGGLMDRSIELSAKDLKELKKVVTNEIKLKTKKR